MAGRPFLTAGRRPVQRTGRCFRGALLSIVAVLGLAGEAAAGDGGAIPSFSRQTGLRCNQCHTTFPQLTSFGRRFKLNGYTLTGLRLIEVGDTATGTAAVKIDLVAPVSTMLEASLTHTAKALPGARNGTAELPQAVSLFLGEEITPSIGTFLQFTYEAATRRFAVDNADVRYAGHTRLGARELIYGLTLNNNPSVQDVWNTTPAWRFPFATSSDAPAPAAAPLVDGGLAQRVAGLGGYALWDNRVYGEFSVYRAAPQGQPHPLGAAADSALSGVAPYWRAVWQQGWRRQYLALGTFGMRAALFPSGVAGPTDRYVDIGFDGQYERRTGRGMLTAHASWIGEWQTLDASLAAGAAANASNTLRSLRLDASYYADLRVGLTVGYFSITGTPDDSLYRGTSGGHRPNSDGVIGELDFLPWMNTRFTLQYVAYDRFDGARTAYDGSRDAADNNTLYLLAWLAF